VADGYNRERAVYFILFSLVVFLTVLELHADWSRKRNKRYVNVHHVYQHWLQLICEMVSLIECVDSGVFGLLPYWLVGLVSASGGCFDAMILEISGYFFYVLASGHYARIQEQPRWLGPFFVSIATVYTIIHVHLQTLRGYGQGGYNFADALNLVCLIVITVGAIDAIFWRIRKLVLASDNAACSTTKLLPRLMKIGRIVAALNVVLLGASILTLYQNRDESASPPPPSPETWQYNAAPRTRLVVLLITMWWTFHRPCPGLKSKSWLKTSATKPQP
jgi:hypothetical protein